MKTTYELLVEIATKLDEIRDALRPVETFKPFSPRDMVSGPADGAPPRRGRPKGKPRK